MAEYIMKVDPEVPELMQLEEPLLRCRDCAHHKVGSTGTPYCCKHHHIAQADGYCAWGRPEEE